MEHVLVLDVAGKTLAARMDPQCRSACFDSALHEVETCVVSGAGRRRRCRHQVEGATVFLCTDDPDLVKSKRQFMRRLHDLIDMYGAFSELHGETVKRLQAENRRLVHNLTALNSHILQEVYSIAPQDQLIGDANQQIHKIKQAILSDPMLAASAALRILKNAIAARTEMQTVRLLQPSGNDRPTLQPKNHVLHRVVTNALIAFFQDSVEYRLNWKLKGSKTTALFDYQTLSAALYRIFENAIKYCQPGSDIEISFPVVGRTNQMTIEMTSLWISEAEGVKIFEEGYSGDEAKLAGLQGDGLGLYFVQEMLKFNHAHIHWEPIISSNPKYGRFGRNRFVISFAARTVAPPTALPSRSY